MGFVFELVVSISLEVAKWLNLNEMEKEILFKLNGKGDWFE